VSAKVQAGRDLDRQIASLVGDHYDEADNKWTSTNGTWISCADGGPQHYSTSIGAVWYVVDALSARGCSLVLEDWRNDPRAPGKWSALFNLPDGHDTGGAMGETAPEAICRAALRVPTRLL
jgi:hypothetical protein